MEFFEAPAFTRYLRTYLDHEGFLALQLFLTDQPEAGDVMPGTGGSGSCAGASLGVVTD